MDWVTSIHQAIQYIEEHLREELTIREIAQQAALSPFYFQKGFAMLCGMTVGDYIRQRRLSAAGLEVLTTDRKIIDIALEFGYDSPDSFTKAFVRFHGLTPAALRKSGGAVRSFAPLRIKVTLEGGQNMDCKIMKKEAFTVLCRAKTFKYEDAAAQVPQFWAEHFGTGGGKVVCGMYGINLDESMGGNEFEYLIADNYDPAKEIPDGFTTRTIGGVIMTHGDNRGLVLPPRVAPIQVVVIPVAQHKQGVLEANRAVMDRLKSAGFRVKLDDSDQSAGWKFAEYEMKGVPLRLELGPKDMEKNQCVLVRRDSGEKSFVSLDNIEQTVAQMLDAIHDGLYAKAKKNLEEHIFEAHSLEEAKALQAQHGIAIPKTKIVQDEPIKAFGGYELKVKLGYEVTGTLKVVVAEA